MWPVLKPRYGLIIQIFTQEYDKNIDFIYTFSHNDSYFIVSEIRLLLYLHSAFYFSESYDTHDAISYILQYRFITYQ